MVFEFDPQKSASNKTKHGIDFVEAQALWHGRTVRLPSNQPQHGEARYLLFGKIGSKHWTAIITFRGDIRRIISVRSSKTEEVQIYENRVR